MSSQPFEDDAEVVCDQVRTASFNILSNLSFSISLAIALTRHRKMTKEMEN
jgi:hypothetical protein